MLFLAQYCSICAFVNELWDTEFYEPAISSQQGGERLGRVLVIMDQNIRDHRAFEGRGESVLTSCQVLVLIWTSIDQPDKGKHEILKYVYQPGT